jgi:hypothetical protein
MTNDEKLIHDILEGDRNSFGALVEPYIDRLHAISYSYLGDAHAAEDVTQDALIRAFTSLRTLADPRKFGPWLRQITRNLSRSEARRNKCVTVDSSNQRARRSLWISTAVAMILTLGIVLVTWTLVPRLEGPHFLLGLSLFLLLPFAFITLYFYRAGATGRMKLSMLFYLAIVACIVCMVVFPQHAVLFALCLGPLFAGATAAEASWNPALTRPGSGDPPATQGDPPSACRSRSNFCTRMPGSS